MIEVRLAHAFSAKQGGFALDASINVHGGCVALYGHSGSGKTLTLHSIAGLFTPGRGFVRVGERVLLDTEKGVNMPARRRNLGYLFQDYALFPHLTVRQNIAFSLGPFRSPRKRRLAGERVQEMLECFEIQHLAAQRPGMISGGQRQRVALARALAFRPDVLLLDEPFSALDPQLRGRVRAQCREWLRRFGIPAVIITHDPLDVVEFATDVIYYTAGSTSRPYPVDEFRPEISEQPAYAQPQ